MKIKNIIMILPLFCFPCFGTHQMPDVFIDGELKGDLFVSFASYQSPLEQYFSQKEKSPFVMWHTANYRGYVAHWEVVEKKLYLQKIMVQGNGSTTNKYGMISEKLEPYDLSQAFKSDVPESGIFAEWFTGTTRVFLRTNSSEYISGTQRLDYIFEKGMLVERIDLNEGQKVGWTNITVVVEQYPDSKNEK